MSLTLQQQLTTKVTSASNILITFKKNHSADAVASSLALKLLLEKMGKHVDIVSDGFVLDTTYQFLPKSECISSSIEGINQMKICIDASQIPIKDLSYAMEGQMLNIIVTPKSGSLSKEHISTHTGQYKYDLIITIDTQDLASLGDVFKKHDEFFYKTTIINIDHDIQNENYGQINYTNPNVTSVAELVFEIAQLLDPTNALIDEHIAQCLLCGLIAKTKSFKSAQVTPATLHIATRLMQAGAKRDEIVKHLYYTKSITTLKLWGKVLSRLKTDPTGKIAHSWLIQKDFDELKTTPQKVADVIEELMVTAPEAKIIVLMYEYQGIMHGVLYSQALKNAQELAIDLSPTGDKRIAYFHINQSDIHEALNIILKKIHERLEIK